VEQQQEVEQELEQAQQQEILDNPNPVDRRTRWEFNPTVEQEYTIKDADGDVMLNSAGDPLAPWPIEWISGSARARKSVETLAEVSAVIALNGTRNAASYTTQYGTYAAGKLRLTVGASDEQRENEYTYYTVTGLFEYNVDGWGNILRADEGFNIIERDAISGEYVKARYYIEGREGPVPSPVPVGLNGVGEATDTPATLTFSHPRSVAGDWSTLPF